MIRWRAQPCCSSFKPLSFSFYAASLTPAWFDGGMEVRAYECNHAQRMARAGNPAKVLGNSISYPLWQDLGVLGQTTNAVCEMHVDGLELTPQTAFTGLPQEVMKSLSPPSPFSKQMYTLCKVECQPHPRGPQWLVLPHQPLCGYWRLYSIICGWHHISTRELCSQHKKRVKF